MNKSLCGLALLVALVMPSAVAAQPLEMPCASLSTILRPTPYVDNIDLDGTNAKTVTVPNFLAMAGSFPGPYVAIFRFSGQEFRLRVGGTATVAGADVTNGAASMSNPVALVFDRAKYTTFSVISSTAGDLAISWYLLCPVS